MMVLSSIKVISNAQLAHKLSTHQNMLRKKAKLSVLTALKNVAVVVESLFKGSIQYFPTVQR